MPNHFGCTPCNDRQPTAARICARSWYSNREGGKRATATAIQHTRGYVPTGTVGGVNLAPPPRCIGTCGLGVPFVKSPSVIFDNSGASGGDFTSPNYTTLESSAYNDTMRISSNSWGASNNTYTIDGQEYDALVRDAQPSTSGFPVAGNQEYVILFAAGNDGSGANTVGTPGTAKNVITVGAPEGAVRVPTARCWGFRCRQHQRHNRFLESDRRMVDVSDIVAPEHISRRRRPSVNSESCRKWHGRRPGLLQRCWSLRWHGRQ
jgi:hypothetical protein